MCNKCAEYDQKIERYRRLASQVADDVFAERVGKLVAELITDRERSCDDKRDPAPKE